MSESIYPHITPVFAAHMAKVDTLTLEELRRLVKFILDDLYGCGDGLHRNAPRGLDFFTEFSPDTLDNVVESLEQCTSVDLNENDLETCQDCGALLDDGEGYDGLCGPCRDVAECEDCERSYGPGMRCRCNDDERTDTDDEDDEAEANAHIEMMVRRMKPTQVSPEQIDADSACQGIMPEKETR